MDFPRLSPRTSLTAAYGLRLGLWLLLLWTAVITAWVGDDAQITFRQVWNFIHGDGITFNYGQRVQAFSHPTWFLLLSGLVFVTRELFMTTIALSIALSLAAVALLLALEARAAGLGGWLDFWRGSGRGAGRDSGQGNGKARLALLTPALLLPFSIAFCDYMTSGLENPLSYFLVGLLLWLVAGGDKGQNRRWGFLVLALLVLNRFDYAALFLPLAAWLAAGSFASAGMRGLAGAWRDIWPGAALLGAWLLFALIYFGSPLPNPFYAKMLAGYPTMEYIERGLTYFWVTGQRDPATLLVIAAGLLASFIARTPLLLSLAAGQLLYLAFILYAGGDFMQGRFFAVPAFLAVGQLLLASASRNHQPRHPR